MVKCGQGLQAGGLAAGARLLGVVHGCEACGGSAGVGPLTCDMARWACGDGALGRQQDLLSAQRQGRHGGSGSGSGARGGGLSDDGIFALTHHRRMETWGLQATWS